MGQAVQAAVRKGPLQRAPNDKGGVLMAEKRSVSYLQGHTGELLELCRRTGEPVFLSGDRGEEAVLLSRAAYESYGKMCRPMAGQFCGPGGVRERFFDAARQLRECAGDVRRPRRRRK